MSSGLTKEQKEELQKLIDELNTTAKDVFKDYNDNPSEISGSVTQIHIDSPILDENNDIEWIHKRISKESNDFYSVKTL